MFCSYIRSFRENNFFRGCLNLKCFFLLYSPCHPSLIWAPSTVKGLELETRIGLTYLARITYFFTKSCVSGINHSCSYSVIDFGSSANVNTSSEPFSRCRVSAARHKRLLNQLSPGFKVEQPSDDSPPKYVSHGSSVSKIGGNLTECRTSTWNVYFRFLFTMRSGSGSWTLTYKDRNTRAYLLTKQKDITL